MKDVSGKPNVILCDIDGTLTLEPHNRSPYEWDKVSNDLPNKILISCLRGLQNDGYKIIFMSGRDSICYTDTIDWICKYMQMTKDDVSSSLYMRKIGDMRKDTIVKEELFFEHIDGNYQVAGVFDDRPVVCNFWRDLHLKVYQCANPYIHF